MPGRQYGGRRAHLDSRAIAAVADTAAPRARRPSPQGRLARAADLLVALTVADVRTRYGRGPWRLGKWLADPFALLGVYLILVGVVLDRPGRAPALVLACAVVPFQLVIGTIATGLDALRLRAPILLNMTFPKRLLPLTTACTQAVTFAACLVMLPLAMAVHGVAPTAAALWLVPMVLLTFLLAAAMTYPVTLVALWLPDLRAFVMSGARALFFVAPGLTALATVHGAARGWLELNPLTGLFEGYRAALLYDTAPAPWMLLVPLAWAVVIAAVTVPLWAREEDHLVKVM